MTSKPQPEVNLEYYVGFEEDDEEGIILYTIYPEAVSILADVGVEFTFEQKSRAKTTGRMRSVTKLEKLPKIKKSTGLIFYDIEKINKKVPKRSRKAVAEACNELERIDEKRNKLEEMYQTEKDRLDAAEAQQKTKIRSNLTAHGPLTEKGRYYHRMMLIDTIRVSLITNFTFAVDTSNFEEITAKVGPKYRKLLTSCMMTDMVRIDPEFYERKVKQFLTPTEKKKFVDEVQDIDQDKFEDEILPSLPYDMRLMFWSMTEQFNELGEPAFKVQRYTAKNPQCQECGGKFVPKTNVCRDCGLTSFEEVNSKAEKVDGGDEVVKKIKPKTRPRRTKAILKPVKTIEDFLKKKIKSKK